MKAILMAAGVGSRLAKDLDRPKCTWEVGDMPLIKRTAELLTKNNIEIVMIVGYKKEKIFEVLKDYPVKYYYNPFFRATNSLGSLWFAKEELDYDDDIILGNADVFWGQEILDTLMQNDHDAVLLGDNTRSTVGDYFFKTENDMLVAYGKDLSLQSRSCEYVGLAKLKREFLPTFSRHVQELVDAEAYHLWWENALYEYCKQYPVYIQDVNGLFWGEIDYIEDYNRIRRHALDEANRAANEKETN